jgi:membrane dipeptidase
MEKSSELPVDEKHATTQHSRPRRRPLSALDNVIFVIVLLLIACTLWFSAVRGLFPAGQKHGCKGSLTVEERAASILKENPLIG